MSVPEQDPVTLHTGNGVTTVFAYQFLLTLAADLVVTVGGVVKTLNVDYTVNGLGTESGGDVTFTVAPASAASIILQRVIALERDTDYQNFGDFKAETVNADFDRLWQALQGTNEELDRAVRVPVGSTIDPEELIDELLAVQAAAEESAAEAEADRLIAQAAAAAAAASAASTGLPSLIGKTLNWLRVKADESGYEVRTPAEARADIGAAKAGADDTITSTSALATMTNVATINTSPVTWVPARQSILAGAAAFVQIGTGLACNLLATTTPVRFSFAAGMNANGAVDYVGSVSADSASFWSGLTASTTNYLFVDRNTSTGALTGVASILPYIEQASSASISVASGQHTYVHDTGQMYVGNGSVATAVQRTAVGQCVTNGSAVTSVISYAKLGRASGSQTTLALETPYSFNHYIGTNFLHVARGYKCKTTDAGYPVGHKIYDTTGDSNGSTIFGGTMWTTSTTCGITIGPGSGSVLLQVPNLTTAAVANLDPAKWEFFYLLERGFK